MPENSIGDFRFLSLTLPDNVKQRVIVSTRPGVPGAALWLTGTRGLPFEATSKVDAPSLAGAIGLLRQYEELIGQDPVDMVWNDIPVTDGGTQLAVLGVAPIAGRVFRLASSTGGLHPPGYGWIEARWNLILLPTD